MKGGGCIYNKGEYKIFFLLIKVEFRLFMCYNLLCVSFWHELLLSLSLYFILHQSHTTLALVAMVTSSIHWNKLCFILFYFILIAITISFSSIHFTRPFLGLFCKSFLYNLSHFIVNTIFSCTCLYILPLYEFSFPKHLTLKLSS